MSHPRSDMRAAVRAALQASPALTGVTVYASWARALGASEMPAVGVFTPREAAESATGDSTNKVTTLVVAYRAEGDDTLEDDLDAVSAVIEPLVLAVLADAPLYGLDATEIEISGEGEKPAGLLTLTFTATRFADEGQAA